MAETSRTLLLGVTGSVAAFRAVELASALAQEGWRVLTIMTAAAREFVQRLGRILRRGDGKQAVLYEVIARETREERVADRRRTPPDVGRKAERIEATLALFDPKRPAGSEPSR